MKNWTMGASALALIAAAGTAGAQEWSVSVSGGSVAGFGYIDTDIARHDTVIVSRTDATIAARLVADNGLTFGSSLTLLANANGSDAGQDIAEDGYGVFVSGSFGRLDIGTANGPQRAFLPRVPRTAFTGAGRGGGLLFDGEYNRGETPAGGLPDDRGANLGTNRKIAYTTPSFSGFAAGIAYSPGQREFSNTASSNISQSRPGEGIEFGAGYRGNFGDFSVQVGGGYTTFLNNPRAGSSDSGYAFGGQVGFAGFALGATYGVNDRVRADDVEMLALGASYRTGPWAFALNYGIALGGNTGTTTIDRNREDDYGLSFGVDYALAPGVVVGGSVEYSEADRTHTTAAGRDDSAFGVGVFMGLSF